MSIDPPIYCGFFAGKGFFNKAIRLLTGGDVDHAFFAYWDTNWNAWLTVGANANGLTLLTVPGFCKSRTIRYLYAPIGWNIWDGLRAHVSDLGREYSYAGLFGMANVEIVKKLTGRPGANPPVWFDAKIDSTIAGRPSDVFCSQWCSMIVRAAMGAGRSGNFLVGYTDDQIDPSTMAAAVKSAKFFATTRLCERRNWRISYIGSHE